jgi:hypothetical protein
MRTSSVDSAVMAQICGRNFRQNLKRVPQFCAKTSSLAAFAGAPKPPPPLPPATSPPAATPETTARATLTVRWCEHVIRWCPRLESNQRTRLRRPVLYPLSYEGGTAGRA